MATPYKIQAGDTLSAIAKKQGTTVEAIMGANKDNPSVKSRDLILAGGNLNLPAAPGDTGAPAEGTANRALDIIGGGAPAGGTPSFTVISEAVRGEETRKGVEADKAVADLTKERDRLTLEKQVADLRASLGPEGGAPAVPGLEAKVTSLIGEPDAAGKSLLGLQNEVIGLNKQKAETEARLAAFRRKEPEGVAAGFAAGRISREEQAVQDEVDRINRDITTASLQIQNRATIINTIMDFAKTDYANASARYNDELSKNIQLYTALGTRSNVAADNARANLQILMTSIKGGNLDPNALPATTSAMITELEAQAEMPSGITSFILKNAKADVLSVSPRTTPGGTEVWDVLYKDLTKETITRGPGEPSSSEGLLATKEYAQLASVGIDRALADKLMQLRLVNASDSEMKDALKADGYSPNLLDRFYNVTEQ